ncbi:MAG TPA: septum formation initiator family protein [Bacteroidetes bacterium]|nr:septum formation initiator family protein [Bacteroidota bacterium]
MNEFFGSLFNRIPPILRNRYFLTLMVFLVWIIIFDNNNLIQRYHYMKNLRQLEKDREYYQERIEEDMRKLNELKTSNENLEKFAREQYFMKKDNEDIYIIVNEDGEKLTETEKE